MLVGFGGVAKSGKDTAASALADQRGYEVVAFVDPLKKLAAACNPLIQCDRRHEGRGGVRYNDLVADVGYTRAKDVVEVRRFLQDLGTEGCRTVFGDDIFVNTVLGDMYPGVDYAVSSVRFPNELAAIKASRGLSIWVQRPGFYPINDHASDNSVTADDFDVTVHNDGTIEDLARRVFEAVDVLSLV